MFSEMMSAMTERFCVMERRLAPDGEGGFVARYEEGAQFDAAVAHDTTILAQTAEAQDTASTYTFIVRQSIPLAFPDIVKRLSDGEVFQITSDSKDRKTPSTSALNAAAVTAKKWRLP